MTLGLSARATAPRSKAFLGLKMFSSSPLATLATAAEDFAEQRGLRELVHATWEGDVLHLELHPLGEPIEVALADGELRLYASTSNVGPGLHACLCDLLDHWASACGIVWQLDGLEYADETGYHATRSFEALQDEMAGWLRALASSVCAHAEAGATDVGVCLRDVDGTPLLGELVATPHGPRDLRSFQEIAAAQDEDLRRLAAEWFVWWDREPNAAFWYRSGLGLAWTAIPWHAPDSETTRSLYEVTLGALDKASRLDPRLPFPSDAVAEMHALLEDEEMSPPAPRGIGYHRLPWRRELAEDWTIVVPGYFYRTSDEEGDALLHRDLTVHATAFLAKGAAHAALADFRDEGPVQESFEAEGVSGVARWSRPEGEPSMLLEGIVATDRHFVAITMAFPDRTALPGALAAFRSIRFVEEEADLEADEDTDN